MKKKRKQRKFFKKNPQYKGASLRKTLALKKLIFEQTLDERNFGIMKSQARLGAKPTDKQNAIAQRVRLREEEILALESLVLAEAEANRFQLGFMHDMKNIRKGNLSETHLERAGMPSRELEQRTALANRYNGGRFVDNRTQEFMVRSNNNKLRRSPVQEYEYIEEIRTPKPMSTGMTRRALENELLKITHLQTSAKTPSPSNSRTGIDFSPFTNLGLKISSVRYKRSNVDKNKREQRLSVVLNNNGKNIAQDVRVVYKYSINEHILMNIDKYNLDTSALSRFKFTYDPRFKDRNIVDLFRINAPGAKVVFVKGSLKIIDDTHFAGKLKVMVGTLAAVIPFKGSL